MYKLMIQNVILLIIFNYSLLAQDKSKCYFDIFISNETRTISDYAIKNIAVKSIEQNMPNSMIRSYDSNESMRFVLKIYALPINNKLGVLMGITFSIYGSIRTYPTMYTAFMPENQTMGYTGETYDSSFLRQLIDGVVANNFGELDELKEMIIKYMNLQNKR